MIIEPIFYSPIFDPTLTHLLPQIKTLGLIIKPILTKNKGKV